MPKPFLKQVKLRTRQKIHNHLYGAGDLVTVDPDVARALVSQGHASYHTPPPPPALTVVDDTDDEDGDAATDEPPKEAEAEPAKKPRKRTRRKKTTAE